MPDYVCTHGIKVFRGDTALKKLRAEPPNARARMFKDRHAMMAYARTSEGRLAFRVLAAREFGEGRPK